MDSLSQGMKRRYYTVVSKSLVQLYRVTKQPHYLENNKLVVVSVVVNVILILKRHGRCTRMKRMAIY